LSFNSLFLGFKRILSESIGAYLENSKFRSSGGLDGSGLQRFALCSEMALLKNAVVRIRNSSAVIGDLSFNARLGLPIFQLFRANRQTNLAFFAVKGK
jgi:hypothetical protein